MIFGKNNEDSKETITKYIFEVSLNKKQHGTIPLDHIQTIKRDEILFQKLHEKREVAVIVRTSWDWKNIFVIVYGERNH